MTPETTTFHLLHLSLLREYIDHEFGGYLNEPGVLDFDYNLESIIDDWILMGFLVGNDFLPHLPHLHINKGAFSELFSTYKRVLPTLGGKMLLKNYVGNILILFDLVRILILRISVDRIFSYSQYFFF